MTRFLALALIVCGAVPALAFDLEDHAAITRQAIREFEICFPGSISDRDAQDFVGGNLDEDINLPRKWALYSHYFNPERPIKMRRKNSLDRIQDIESSLRHFSGPAAAGESPLAFLEGGIIHHLQDSAVPPHVLPISHGLWDGFESYETGQIAAPTAVDLNCASISPETAADPVQLLQASARETLAAVRHDAFVARDVSDYDVPLTLSWELLWADGKGDQFGEYGIWGNVFGDADVFHGAKEYLVDPQEYHRFKQRRVRQAIQVTKQAIAWALRSNRRSESVAALSGAPLARGEALRTRLSLLAPAVSGGAPSVSWQ